MGCYFWVFVYVDLWCYFSNVLMAPWGFSGISGDSFWKPLAAIWGFLGPSWGGLGGVLGISWRFLGRQGAQDAPKSPRDGSQKLPRHPQRIWSWGCANREIVSFRSCVRPGEARRGEADRVSINIYMHIHIYLYIYIYTEVLIHHYEHKLVHPIVA